MGENFVIQVSAIGIVVGSFLIHLQWQRHQLKKAAIRVKSRSRR